METDLAELRAQVASRFDLLGLPSWPDPHPDMAAPRDEEYSRVTDPGRYAVVHARARVWTQVLRDTLGAQVEAFAPADEERATFDRGVRVTPERAGAQALLLLERDALTAPGEPPLAVLRIAVARLDLVVEMQPDCGCDACDSGSTQLLEAIDDAVCRIVEGPFVLLRNATWDAQWYPGGGGMSTTGEDGPAFEAAMALCRRLADGDAVRLPAGTEAVVGRTWLG